MSDALSLLLPMSHRLGPLRSWSSLICVTFYALGALLFNGQGEVHATPALTVFPLDAPHLSGREALKQTHLLLKEINRTRDLKPVELKRVQRATKRARLSQKTLSRPREALEAVCSLTRKTKSAYALSVLMKLGTDRAPPVLIGSLYFCRTPRRVERFEVPFEGRLNKGVWSIFTELLLETYTRPPDLVSGSSSYPQATSPEDSPAPAPLFSPPPSTLTPQAQPSPIGGISPPDQTVTTSPSPSTDQPLLSPPSALVLDQPRFTLSGGARFYLRDFSYETAQRSPLLKGGIQYRSGWIIGWGGRISLRPLSGNTRTHLGRFALTGDFEHYQFTSLRTLPDPFGEDDQSELVSSFLRWGAGLKYSVPFSSGNRAHAAGAEFTFRSGSFLVLNNPEYNGFQRLQVEMSIFGSLTLFPRHLWLNLKLGVSPWASLGESTSELGTEAQHLGASAEMGVHYRSEVGISLGTFIHFDYLLSEITGRGRGGRVGEVATDQMITGGVSLGFSSSPPTP